MHVLTTAALAAAELNYPAGNWDPHRFRPTLLIDAEGDDFIENGWTGRGLAVGDVVLDVLMPTIRCTMTTKAQPEHGIERDVDIFKSLKFANSQNLGAYANVRTPGRGARRRRRHAPGFRSVAPANCNAAAAYRPTPVAIAASSITMRLEWFGATKPPRSLGIVPRNAIAPGISSRT